MSLSNSTSKSFPLSSCARCSRVSESGYYAWLKRPICQRKREDADLKKEIEQVFTIHQGRYGSPRIYRELRDQGRSISRKRIARLMREVELTARRKRRRVLTTRRDVSHPVAINTRKSGIYGFLPK